MGRQPDADRLDREMLARGLPEHAVDALDAWRAGPGRGHARGTASHSVAYVPAAWAAIDPWPARLGTRTNPEKVRLSRAEVHETARLAAAGGVGWTEALVAAYVWGQGANGYGPHRLAGILAAGPVEPVLEKAVAALADEGAVAAYRVMNGAVTGLGAAFFTKFLYVAGEAVQRVEGPRPLILDKRLALVLRAHAGAVARDTGLPEPDGLARWIWSDGGWTSHRYGVYLAWMHDAARRLEAARGWPPAPDLLELALFSGAWTPVHPA